MHDRLPFRTNPRVEPGTAEVRRAGRLVGRITHLDQAAVPDPAVHRTRADAGVVAAWLLLGAIVAGLCVVAAADAGWLG